MPEPSPYVTGPHVSEAGFIYFQCTKPGCTHEADGTPDACPGVIRWHEYQVAAIGEGFCPLHPQCRLQPCDPPQGHWPGLQAQGRCPRTGYLHSTGEAPDPIGTWIATDYPEPLRHTMTRW